MCTKDMSRGGRCSIRGGTPTPVQAELRIEPQRVASRIVAEARAELDQYFKSTSGRSQHRTESARRDDVTMVLRAVAVC